MTWLLGLIPGAGPFLAAAGAFLKKLPWKWILIGLAATLLVREIERHGYHERDEEVAGLQRQIKSLTEASAAAGRQNEAEVKQQIDTQAQLTKDANHDDQIRAAGYDAAVADYKRLHPYTAPVGSCGALGLPACPDPARRSDTEAAIAKLHDPVVVEAGDLDICKGWVLKGQSWDDYWPKAAKVINDLHDASMKAAAADR